MTAIAATRRTVKELVDGTLRVTVDVEPMNKAAFLLAFPEVDAPIALAPLKYGGNAGDETPVWTEEQIKQNDALADRLLSKMRPCQIADADDPNYWTGPGLSKSLEQADKPKGGPHSQDAARICKDDWFQSFLSVPDEKAAAAHVRVHCGIESRSELDHNPEALQRFHILMREFNKWRERAG